MRVAANESFDTVIAAESTGTPHFGNKAITSRMAASARCACVHIACSPGACGFASRNLRDDLARIPIDSAPRAGEATPLPDRSSRITENNRLLRDSIHAIDRDATNTSPSKMTIAR